MAEEIVIHKTAEPYKVKLIKGMKDVYGWEISVSGDKSSEILNVAEAIDSKLRLDYGDKLGGS